MIVEKKPEKTRWEVLAFYRERVSDRGNLRGVEYAGGFDTADLAFCEAVGGRAMQQFHVDELEIITRQPHE